MGRFAKWTNVHQNTEMGRQNHDAEHLSRLRDYYAQHQALPSYAHMSKLLRFQAKNASLKLARRLIEAGFLQTGPSGRLVPGQRFFERPYLDDKVPAGTGEPGLPMGGVEHHAIDRLLVSVPSRTMLVPVRGDSMVDAGVLDGDTAVVERTDRAAHGDFIVAVVDGRYTLKELRLERNKPMLVPHNPSYRPITPTADMSIIGVVTGIVRRYRTTVGRAARRSRGEQA